MKLLSGYRIEYDSSKALARLEAGDSSALDELWENLYHQGDVDSASYAATPKLLELGAIQLVAAIEIARHADQNPKLPKCLELGYFASLNAVLSSPIPVAEEDLKSYYAIHASVNGQLRLAKVLDFISVGEFADEYL